MVLLRAKEADIYIGSSLASPSSSTTLFSQITGQLEISARVKNIEISGAEADTEEVYLFGSDANGRQNAEVEEQNMTQREFTGTLVFQDNVPASWTSGTAVAVGSTGYTRVQGDGTRYPKAIVIHTVDSLTGAVLDVILNDFRFTKMGDISWDAEGHAEQEVAGKCLSKNYFEEYTA